MRKELIKCMCRSEDLNLETNINVVRTKFSGFGNNKKCYNILMCLKLKQYYKSEKYNNM